MTQRLVDLPRCESCGQILFSPEYKVKHDRTCKGRSKPDPPSVDLRRGPRSPEVRERLRAAMNRPEVRERRRAAMKARKIKRLRAELEDLEHHPEVHVDNQGSESIAFSRLEDR